MNHLDSLDLKDPPIQTEPALSSTTPSEVFVKCRRHLSMHPPVPSSTTSSISPPVSSSISPVDINKATCSSSVHVGKKPPTHSHASHTLTQPATTTSTAGSVSLLELLTRSAHTATLLTPKHGLGRKAKWQEWAAVYIHQKPGIYPTIRRKNKATKPWVPDSRDQCGSDDAFEAPTPSYPTHHPTKKAVDLVDIVDLYTTQETAACLASSDGDQSEPEDDISSSEEGERNDPSPFPIENYFSSPEKGSLHSPAAFSVKSSMTDPLDAALTLSLHEDNEKLSEEMDTFGLVELYTNPTSTTILVDEMLQPETVVEKSTISEFLGVDKPFLSEKIGNSASETIETVENKLEDKPATNAYTVPELLEAVKKQLFTIMKHPPSLPKEQTKALCSNATDNIFDANCADQPIQTPPVLNDMHNELDPAPPSPSSIALSAPHTDTLEENMPQDFEDEVNEKSLNCESSLPHEIAFIEAIEEKEPAPAASFPAPAPPSPPLPSTPTISTPTPVRIIQYTASATTLALDVSPPLTASPEAVCASPYSVGDDPRPSPPGSFSLPRDSDDSLSLLQYSEPTTPSPVRYPSHTTFATMELSPSHATTGSPSVSPPSTLKLDEDVSLIHVSMENEGVAMVVGGMVRVAPAAVDAVVGVSRRSPRTRTVGVGGEGKEVMGVPSISPTLRAVPVPGPVPEYLLDLFLDSIQKNTSTNPSPHSSPHYTASLSHNPRAKPSTFNFEDPDFIPLGASDEQPLQTSPFLPLKNPFERFSEEPDPTAESKQPIFLTSLSKNPFLC